MIDSHAHVAFSQFDEDRDEVITRAREAGVEGWIEIGTTVKQSEAALALAREHEGVWASVGIHPSDIGPMGDPDGDRRGPAEEMTEVDVARIAELLKEQEVVAVGEVGLDLYHVWPGYSLADQLAKQHEALSIFISMALEKKLPIIFHVRSNAELDAHEELLKLLESLPTVPAGVLHTFSGTWEQAQRYLALGLHLSISGVATFKNAGDLVVVVERAPMEQLLLETDCPFLAPDPYRGKRNEPAYVRLVAEKVAAVRGESVDTIAGCTTENTKRLFVV